MKPTTTLAILALLALLVLAPAHAQVPSILNYQGRVTVGGTNLTTNAAQFKFALVNGDGTTVYWKNDGTTTTNEPSSAVTVAVAQGLYSALLGDTTLSNMASIPGSAFTNENVNLRVWFSGGGTNPFVQLSPDQRIGAAGYALRAAAADSANVTNVSGDLAVSGTLSVGQLVAGENSVASGSGAAIGGGSENTASAPLSVIGGGMFNTASANFATIGGGQFNTNSGYAGVMGGGQENTASANYAIVGGGYRNTNGGQFATIGGGYANTASFSAIFATIGGGVGNTVSANFATAGGGRNNTASGQYATVGGGSTNTASGSNAVIAGGLKNLASGESAAVGGGQENTASGSYAMVPGGQLNTATNYAFASGYRAKATNDGAFVWADSTDADFGSTTNNQFLVRATGGVGINTNNPGTNALSVAGSANIAGNLNVGSINGQTVLSNYTTTFSFVQNNATSYQVLAVGNNVVATFVQRPGVAITSCSIVYSLTGSFVQGTVNFYDVTGLTAGTVGTNNLIPGGAQTFTDVANMGAYKLYELGGLNIAAPAATPRIVQIFMNANNGGSSQIRLYSITVGFSPNSP